MKRSDVAKVLLEVKNRVHENAVYPNLKTIPSYISLKAFDMILQKILKEYDEGED